MKSFSRINKVKSILELPGDKSISHRSLLFSAMADGESEIRNLSEGEDVLSTISCLKQLGVTILKNNNLYVIKGRGFKGFLKPQKDLYAGNSGTTSRIISGILAAQDFESVITGDASLSRRPMNRIIEPLQEMGASVSSKSGYLPLIINPSLLRPIKYEHKLPSAQVKSCIMLAALHLEEESEIIEHLPSRDHTERMLGLKQRKENNRNYIAVSKKNYPSPNEYFVPSDISSSVFFIVLALLTQGSELIIKNVSLNPSRTGILEIFRLMGGSITEENVRIFSNEPFGDIIVRSSSLKNIEIPKNYIPNIIDEIPALAVAGAFAEGEFIISGAEELRHKESDRISSVCSNLKNNGLMIEEFSDGFIIRGVPDKSKRLLFKSYDDHRIAMAFAVMSMLSESGGEVEGFECVSISNPQFMEQIKSITG